jgi:hypothetical protein
MESVTKTIAKSFKYQKLMEGKGIKDPCPFTDCIEIEIPVFRWGHTPLNSALNFLPNYPYNDAIGAPPRRNSKKDDNDTFRCGMCGLSFFRTKKDAKDSWDAIGEPVQQNLKYTHVLYGDIVKELGVAKNVETPHFLFYEYEGVELLDYFEIEDEL